MHPDRVESGMTDYSIATLQEVPDVSGDAPFEMRMYGRALGSDQLAVTRVRLPGHTRYVPPGMSPAFGHAHRTQEEIYLVTAGHVRVRLGDDVVDLGPGGAVLIPIGVKRAVRNEGDEEAELLLLSVRVEDLRSEVEMDPAFWP